MPFYSFEMVLVGVILLSAMVIGGTRLWLKRRHISLDSSEINDNLEKQDTKLNNSSIDSTKDN